MPTQNGGWWKRNARRVTQAQEQTDAQRSRAPWIVAAFFLALILIATSVWALRVFVFEPSQTEPTSTTRLPDEGTDSLETAPTNVSGADACLLDQNSTDVSTSPPTATRWVVESEIVIPDVPGAGPCVAFDGYRAGFSQTQAGALAASYYYGATLVTNAPEAHTVEQANYALAPGPLKDSILQHIADVQSGVEVRAPEGQKAGQEFVGYRMVDFTSDTAIVELLIQHIESGSTVAAHVTLIWIDGDWRIDPASSTEWAAPVLEPRASDFVRWNQRG